MGEKVYSRLEAAAENGVNLAVEGMGISLITGNCDVTVLFSKTATEATLGYSSAEGGTVIAKQTLYGQEPTMELLVDRKTQPQAGTTIDTGGGAYIQGDVKTGGRDFVGRRSSGAVNLGDSYTAAENGKITRRATFVNGARAPLFFPPKKEKSPDKRKELILILPEEQRDRNVSIRADGDVVIAGEKDSTDGRKPRAGIIDLYSEAGKVVIGNLVCGSLSVHVSDSSCFAARNIETPKVLFFSKDQKEGVITERLLRESETGRPGNIFNFNPEGADLSGGLIASGNPRAAETRPSQPAAGPEEAATPIEWGRCSEIGHSTKDPLSIYLDKWQAVIELTDERRMRIVTPFWHNLEAGEKDDGELVIKLRENMKNVVAVESSPDKMNVRITGDGNVVGDHSTAMVIKPGSKQGGYQEEENEVWTDKEGNVYIRGVGNVVGRRSKATFNGKEGLKLEGIIKIYLPRERRNGRGLQGIIDVGNEGKIIIVDPEKKGSTLPTGAWLALNAGEMKLTRAEARGIYSSASSA